MLLFAPVFALPEPVKKQAHAQKVLEQEALLQQIGTGNMDAFAAFYHQTKGSVYAFALSMLKNQDDACDVMQETYLKIRSAAHLYEPRGTPMAWVLTITRNFSLMRLRSQNRLSPLAEEAEGFSPQALSFVEDHEDRLVLSALLSRLAAQERTIVLLHAVSGMKHREIAHLLGIGLSTELSKYHRAIQKLKKALQEGGYSHA